MYMKKAVILLLLLSLFFSQPVSAQEYRRGSSQNPIVALQAKADSFLSNLAIYNRIMNYIWQERGKKATVLSLAETAVLFAVDLLLSLFCLWLTIFLLTRVKTLVLKSYLWFLLAWNITFAIQILFFRGAWRFLQFAITRLEPNSAGPVLEHYPLVLISVAALLYIWLLCRTLGLNFSGGVGTFLISHFVYFTLIFLVLALTAKLDVNSTARQGLGIRPTIRNYLVDSDNITSGKYLFTLFRIKPFHL